MNAIRWFNCMLTMVIVVSSGGYPASAQSLANQKTTITNFSSVGKAATLQTSLGPTSIQQAKLVSQYSFNQQLRIWTKSILNQRRFEQIVATESSKTPSSPTQTHYLPLTMRSPQLNNSITIQPNTAAILSSIDGAIDLTIPQGAVNHPTLLNYQTITQPNLAGYQAIGPFFQLSAQTQWGQGLEQFNSLIPITVRYPNNTWYSTNLKLMGFNRQTQRWEYIPTTLNRMTKTLTGMINQPSQFGVFAPMSEPCSIALGPTGQPQITQTFSTTYELLSLGCPSTPASLISGTWMQAFPDSGTSFPAGFLVYNANKQQTFYLSNGAKNAFVSNSWLGLPVSNYDPAGPPNDFKDEIHDFTGQPINYFDNGFVISSATTTKAHRWFPKVINAQVTITPHRVGTSNDYAAQLDFNFSFDTFGGMTGIPKLAVSSGEETWTRDGGFAASSWTTSLGSERIPLGNSVQFWMQVQRSTVPSSGNDPDGLIGYAPCTHITGMPVQHVFSIPTITNTVTIKKFPFSCASVIGDDGGIILPPADVTPPTFHYVDIAPIGNGAVYVKAHVTDDRAVRDVLLTFNGNTYPMTTVGTGLYAVKINGKRSGSNSYLLTATDTSNNSSTFPSNGQPIAVPVDQSANFGLSCIDPCTGYQGAAADPINTQNGNYTDQFTDASIAGLGDTTINLSRNYNSLAVFGNGGTIRLTEQGGVVQQQPSAGAASIFGQAWTFPYAMRLINIDDSVASIARVFYPDGQVVTFENSNGIYQATTPKNHDQLTKTANGFELLHQRSLEIDTFDLQGRLISHSDRNGNQITFEYTGDQLSNITNASGRTAQLSYNADGLVETMTLAEGKTLTYRYSNGNLIESVDAKGQATRYTYNQQGQLTTIATPKGHSAITMTYDEQGRVAQQVVGEQEAYTFSYSEDATLTTITDSLNNATKHFYDTEGRLIGHENALGNREIYRYDDDFNRIEMLDRSGNRFTYTYDDQGNRLTEVGPIGWQQAWQYNALNQITTIQDAAGRITRFDYDQRGNLLKVTNPLNGFRSTTYDTRGLPVTIQDFNLNQTTNTFDPITGDLLTSTNGAGDQVAFEYDDLGRVAAMSNGRNTRYNYTYDLNDNLLAIDGPLGYRINYQYDPNDNQTQLIDPNGGSITTSFNASEQVVQISNQLNHSVSYLYDAMGNVRSMTDAEGRSYSYDYDAIYQQVANHAPEDTHTFYAYDPVGNLTRITRCLSTINKDSCNQAQIEARSYDQLNRLSSVIENFDPSATPNADTNVTTTFSYDLVGNLLTEHDPELNLTRYSYDALNRLTQIEDANQQLSYFEYDGMSNLSEYTNPRGFSTFNYYDQANRLARTVDAQAYEWRYVYDRAGNQTHIIDPHQIITLTEYDALDRPSAIIENFVDQGDSTSSQNVRTGLRYDPAGNLRFIDDPRGNYRTEHRYDPSHRRIATIDNEGHTTSFGYDKVDNQIVVVDANKHATQMRFDQLNRLVQMTNPEDHSLAFDYDRLGNLLAVTDARSQRSLYSYDGMNRTKAFTDSLQGVWHYSYDAVGNLLSERDANNHLDQFIYDDLYRLIRYIDAEAIATDFSYDSNGNQVEYTDGNGHITSLIYDPLDRLERITNAELETTQYRYNALGQQTAKLDALGITTEYAYDPLYRLNQVILNQQPLTPSDYQTNVTTRYSYDHVGNLTQITDANGHSTNFSFDGMNRTIREIDAENNQWDYSYDPVGNQIMRIDANRHQTNYRYYPDNQLQNIQYDDNTTVGFSYDPNNNRTLMTDSLGTTSWNYDELNRPIAVTDSLNRQISYAYDAVGNRMNLTYPDGRSVAYRYYQNDWLKQVGDPQQNITSYQRDGVGLPTQTNNPNSTVSTATYDRANRLLSLENHQLPSDDLISSFEYRYDAIGQRTRMEASYGWRNPRNVTSVYQYDPLQRLVRDADSQGIWTEFDYDAVGNRLELRTNDDSLSPRPFDQQTLVYSYNAINQIQTIIGNTHPGQGNVKVSDNVAQALHAFRHEVAAQRGKQISEPSADGLIAQTDDLLALLYSQQPPHSNEINSAIEALSKAVEADLASGAIQREGIAHSLQVKLSHGREALNSNAGTLQTTTFGYDANGNRINKEFPGPQGPQIQGTDYRYDRENRLIEALDYQQNLAGNRVDRAVTRPAYDGIGRRLVKEYDPKDGHSGVKRVEYGFDGLDPIAEYNLWNPQYTHFYRGDQQRIISMQQLLNGSAGQMFWYHYDGLGSVSGLTKQQGQSTHNYRYEAFGQIEMPPGNFSDPHNHYTFTGQELDENLGVYEFFARAYDYETATWLTQDSYRGDIRNPRSLHRLAYVENNPINLVDHYGYWGWNPIKAVSNTISAVADKASEAIDTVSNTVSNTISIVADKASDAVDAGVQWAKENQDTIAKVAITVAATAGTAALCGVTAGIGCVVGAGLIAASASYGQQVVDNVWEASGGTTLFDSQYYNKETLVDNIDWKQVAVDGIMGSLDRANLMKYCKGSMCKRLNNYMGYALTGDINLDEFYKYCHSAKCVTAMTSFIGFSEGALKQLYNNHDDDMCNDGSIFDSGIDGAIEKNFNFMKNKFKARNNYLQRKGNTAMDYIRWSENYNNLYTARTVKAYR